MDWRQRILDHARSLGRDTWEDPLGVGIDFEDGCDAFWALPGEVTSTLPVPPEGPASVDELLSAYDEISRVRERTLHVLRHYLTGRDVRISEGRGGMWGLELADGSSTSIAVGATLTAVARDTRDVYACVESVLKDSWVRKVPTRKRVQTLLGIQGPPDTRNLPPLHQPQQLIPPGIRPALAWLGLCKALDNPESLTSPGSIRAAAEPKGPIAEALLRLDQRVPGVDATVDILRQGKLSLKFDDGYARYEIDIRSKDLARRIRADGPRAAGDRLADEYLALNSVRSRVLRALWQAAAERGWRKQEFGSIPLLTSGTTVSLGSTRREVTFEAADALTQALRQNEPERVLREMFTRAPDFAEACVAALHAPKADAPADLPEAELTPTDAPPAPPLRELDAELVARLDRFAADTARQYLADERTIWKYHNRDVYDPAADTWATPADWLRVAEPLVAKEWPHAMAIVILLDAGDPRGDAAARRYLQRAEPHHEVSDAEVEIAWRYRHNYPEAARRWIIPQGFATVPFAGVRAYLGDPVALRDKLVEAMPEDDTQIDLDSTVDLVRTLPHDRQDAIHRQLVEWAHSTHRWSPPLTERLRLALHMGWRDVADALEDNPFLLPGLLTIDRRPDQFDEPGLLMASDFLLAWSRLAPSTFLARLIATGHETDLLALVREAGRRSAAARPEVAKNVESAVDIGRIWHHDLRNAMAIAWTRCRSAGAA